VPAESGPDEPTLWSFMRRGFTESTVPTQRQVGRYHATGDAGRRDASTLRGGDGRLLSLLNRGEFGACPLRVDDELERIELLVPLPQPVKRLTPEIRQGLARRVVEQP
jgi:hypothetical protein